MRFVELPTVTILGSDKAYIDYGVYYRWRLITTGRTSREDMDPVAVLCEVSAEVMRRLADRFQVTVKSDYHDFPLVLTITVDEYEEDACGSPQRPRRLDALSEKNLAETLDTT